MTQSSPYTPELSVIILCYRAGEGVRAFVENFLRTLDREGIHDYELVLVGNYQKGVEDATPRAVNELAGRFERVTAIAVPKEGMMGWDMRQGFQNARGKYLAVIDGDGQMPVGDVVKAYHAIKEYGVDMVKPYRITRGDSAWRKTVSWCYNAIFHLLFPRYPVHDINAKPKVLTRQAYDQLQLTSDGWFIDAEIVIQARRLSLTFYEFPTVFLGLTGRRSFVRFPAVMEFIKDLFKYRIRELMLKKTKTPL